MRLHVVIFAVVITGCNGFAGIGDLRTGNLDAGDDDAQSDAGVIDDQSAPNGDAAGTDANVALDADVPPACSGTDVGLRITVAPSSTFIGVVDDSNHISAPSGGTPFSRCFARGTQIELMADPDLSNANHVWGAPCSPGRRCAFPLVTALAMDVSL